MSVKLTILGSSGAVPAFGRFPTSQYLIVQNRHFLIDAGEGVQMQLARYQIPVHKIDCIFISHLHGDHYLGLMGLLFSMHLHRRVNDLHLYSQPGLDEIILLQLKYSKSVLNYAIHFHVYDPAQQVKIYEDNVLTVETIPLIHKLPCAGFLFRETIKPANLNKQKLKPGMLIQHIAQLKKGADVYDDHGKLLYRNSDFTLPPPTSYAYAFCSDTAWNEAMIEQIKYVNLLYHEATFMDEDKDKARETKHSTTLEAATIAKYAEVDRLLIGHFSARYRDLDLLLNEAKTIFRNSSLAEEGISFEIPHEPNS
ncbi:MAG: ribonuclease Z [Cyclobacteriaceae bacterium]|nr:ribonuclease Z [Cyclobacteriaceae bacterium]